MWTVIYFLKRFFLDLYHATVFAALEYDDQLRLTKTTQQRIVIWALIIAAAMGVLYVALWGVWYYLDTLVVYDDNLGI